MKITILHLTDLNNVAICTRLIQAYLDKHSEENRIRQSQCVVYRMSDDSVYAVWGTRNHIRVSQATIDQEIPTHDE